jgi:hypothetical protein
VTDAWNGSYYLQNGKKESCPVHKKGDGLRFKNYREITILDSVYKIFYKLLSEKAVPRLKRLVAGLSPRRPGFAPGSIHVGFVVDKVALGRFSPSISVSPAKYHSTIAPYSSITAP